MYEIKSGVVYNRPISSLQSTKIKYLTCKRGTMNRTRHDKIKEELEIKQIQQTFNIIWASSKNELGPAKCELEIENKRTAKKKKKTTQNMERDSTRALKSKSTAHK